jgi:hypothetical protein
MTTIEGIKAALPLLCPKHFLMPFLAHVLGTFVSALVATIIAASHELNIVIEIEIFSLLCGIAAVAMIPAPLWFAVVDLIAAYISMGYLGGKFATKKL